MAKAQKSVIIQGLIQVVFTLIPAAVLFGLHGANKDAECENPLADWLWRYAWLMIGLVFAFIPTFLISLLIMRKSMSAEAGSIATCLTTCCVLLPLAGYAFYWYTPSFATTLHTRSPALVMFTGTSRATSGCGRPTRTTVTRACGTRAATG